MTHEEIRGEVLKILLHIAPEANLEQLRPNARFRDQLDIDSMDFLNFVIGLHERFCVEIPESDYAKMMTLDGCVGYLAQQMDHQS